MKAEALVKQWMRDNGLASFADSMASLPAWCHAARVLEARVTELEAERLQFYHADGTFEVLTTAEEVTRRRIECAQRLGL